MLRSPSVDMLSPLNSSGDEFNPPCSHLFQPGDQLFGWFKNSLNPCLSNFKHGETIILFRCFLGETQVNPDFQRSSKAVFVQSTMKVALADEEIISNEKVD